MFERFPEADFNSKSDHLIIRGYPFPERSTRTIAAQECEEIVDWFPFAIFLKNGDIVFVPRPQAEAVTAFANAHNITITRRVDLWSLLLDPFLDTEFDKDWYERTDEILLEHGLTADYTTSMRDRVRKPMLRLTALTWEWQYYGLYDVLTATAPIFRKSSRRWQNFYTEALEIARLGEIIEDK